MAKDENEPGVNLGRRRFLGFFGGAVVSAAVPGSSLFRAGGAVAAASTQAAQAIVGAITGLSLNGLMMEKFAKYTADFILHPSCIPISGSPELHRLYLLEKFTGTSPVGMSADAAVKFLQNAQMFSNTPEGYAALENSVRALTANGGQLQAILHRLIGESTRYAEVGWQNLLKLDPVGTLRRAKTEWEEFLKENPKHSEAQKLYEEFLKKHDRILSPTEAKNQDDSLSNVSAWRAPVPDSWLEQPWCAHEGTIRALKTMQVE